MKKKIKILVTGANGQLGQELQHIATDYPQFEFVFKSKKSLDITQIINLHEVFYGKGFDYCINCAAYTQVDKAESETDKCIDINGIALTAMGVVAAENNFRLIHISSDYVYNNNPGRPLKEDDDCMPKGMYAYSKLYGEKALQDLERDKSIIIRTSWLYSSYGSNFAKTMLKLAKTKKELSIVNDQIGTPTYAYDLAVAILDMILFIQNNPEKEYHGIYNYSNESSTNWYEYAKAIFSNKKIDIKLIPIPTSDYPTPAPRPLWSVMDKSKIKSTFGLEIRDWQDALDDMLSKIDS